MVAIVEHRLQHVARRRDDKRVLQPDQTPVTIHFAHTIDRLNKPIDVREPHVGGRGGAINARIAAAFLNDTAVRSGLREAGVNLSHDTHFLTAVHDTSCDAVTLLDLDQMPRTRAAETVDIEAALSAAGLRPSLN